MRLWRRLPTQHLSKLLSSLEVSLGISSASHLATGDFGRLGVHLQLGCGRRSVSRSKAPLMSHQSATINGQASKCGKHHALGAQHW